MRLTVTLRLFLALLGACAAVIALMALTLQYSLDRGFLRYINSVETERLADANDSLADFYSAAGSWAPLVNDRRLWQQVVSGDEPGSMPHRGRMRRGGGFAARLILLDTAGRPLIGPAGEPALFQEIVVDQRLVGRIGLVPRRQIAGDPERLFLTNQQNMLIIAATGALASAAVAAWLLSRRILQPVRRLAAATRTLAGGDYAGRVTISGRDEFAALAGDFNLLAETLQRNETHRRRTFADIAHELRTPLAILRGEIEALRDGVRPCTPKAIDSLHQELLRLQRLIDDLHQLALADAGALTYRREELDPAPLLQRLADRYASRFAAADLDLALTLTPGLILFADPQRLEQLVTNLLDNSLKYTDAGGRVHLTLLRHNNDARITIDDSAPAVPAAALPRLFERLYRVEDSRSRDCGGSGLGLAICRAIAEAHGGSICAAPSPLGGVRIIVSFPLTEPA